MARNRRVLYDAIISIVVLSQYRKGVTRLLWRKFERASAFMFSFYLQQVSYGISVSVTFVCELVACGTKQNQVRSFVLLLLGQLWVEAGTSFPPCTDMAYFSENSFPDD